MSNLLDTLADKISTPENKTKLGNFLSVVRDVVSADAKVTVLDTGNRFLLSQKDGTVHVTVSKDFLTNMGDFELGVQGSTPFTGNVHFNMNTPISPVKKAEKKDDKTTIEFTKSGVVYRANVGNTFLDSLDDVRMVNMMKRQPGLPLPAFNVVKKYLEGKGFRVFVTGEEVEEEVKEDEEVHSDPGTTVIQSTPTSEPAIGERVVIKEVPVYVDKIVIKEVPVEVQKVVIKEVPVYIEAEKSVDKDVQSFEVETKVSGPIDDEEEQAESDEEQEESEVDEEESRVESSSEQEEEEEQEEYPAEESVTASENPRKLKGRWLNPQKTILKSGEFVYRVDKKIDGPTVLYALGRWDKDKQKRVALKKGDEKIIKKLGNKIAKNK
jgi:hypothetical protein